MNYWKIFENVFFIYMLQSDSYHSDRFKKRDYSFDFFIKLSYQFKAAMVAEWFESLFLGFLKEVIFYFTLN